MSAYSAVSAVVRQHEPIAPYWHRLLFPLCVLLLMSLQTRAEAATPFLGGTDHFRTRIRIALSHCGKSTWDSGLERAQAFYNQGNYVNALAELESVTFPSIRDSEVYVKLRIGSLWRVGRSAEARLLLESSLTERPDLASLWDSLYALDDTASETGDRGPKAENIDRAIRGLEAISPRTDRVRIYLARAQYWKTLRGRNVRNPMWTPAECRELDALAEEMMDLLDREPMGLGSHDLRFGFLLSLLAVRGHHSYSDIIIEEICGADRHGNETDLVDIDLQWATDSLLSVLRSSRPGDPCLVMHDLRRMGSSSSDSIPYDSSIASRVYRATDDPRFIRDDFPLSMLYILGYHQFAHGELLAARKSYELILERNSHFVRTANNLAYLEQALGNRDKAAALWLQDLSNNHKGAVATSEGYFQLLENLARCATRDSVVDIALRAARENGIDPVTPLTAMLYFICCDSQYRNTHGYDALNSLVRGSSQRDIVLRAGEAVRCFSLDDAEQAVSIAHSVAIMLLGRRSLTSQDQYVARRLADVAYMAFRSGCDPAQTCGVFGLLTILQGRFREGLGYLAEARTLGWREAYEAERQARAFIYSR